MKREGEATHLTTFSICAQDFFLRERLAPQHIWLAEFGAPTTRRLTTRSWTLEFVLPPGSAPLSLSWLPDGQQIAFAQAVAPESGKLDSVHVSLLDVQPMRCTGGSGDGVGQRPWASVSGPAALSFNRAVNPLVRPATRATAPRIALILPAMVTPRLALVTAVYSNSRLMTRLS